LAKPLRIGLTGSIGMGKSETLRIFAALGLPVYDSDAAVHALYEEGGAAVPLVAAEFPPAVKNGKVDRAELSRQVIGDAARMRDLEALVHPLLAQARRNFLARHAEAEMVVLDIPLLFEIGADKEMDRIVVVSAPADVQQARVLARPGMTAEKLATLNARQWSDARKRAQADFVIETGEGLAHAQAQAEDIIARIRSGHA
jgi:dephospho-CoA kinase